jgi:hypothetical protein
VERLGQFGVGVQRLDQLEGEAKRVFLLRRLDPRLRVPDCLVEVGAHDRFERLEVPGGVDEPSVG